MRRASSVRKNTEPLSTPISFSVLPRYRSEISRRHFGDALVNLFLGKKDPLDFRQMIVVHALTNRSARPYLKIRFSKSF